MKVFLSLFVLLSIACFVVADPGEGYIIKRTIPAQFVDGVQISSEQIVHFRQTLNWGSCTSSWDLLLTEIHENEARKLRRIVIEEGIAGLELRGFECVSVILVE